MGDIMEFYFPTEFGERLAFFAVAFTALLGLVVMLAPGMAFAFLGLQTRDGRPKVWRKAGPPADSCLAYRWLPCCWPSP